MFFKIEVLEGPLKVLPGVTGLAVTTTYTIDALRKRQYLGDNIYRRKAVFAFLLVARNHWLRLAVNSEVTLLLVKGLIRLLIKIGY